MGGKGPVRAKGLEAVAESNNSLQVLLAVCAELGAQPANVHIQGSRLDLVAITPHARKEHFPGHDLAGVLDQQREQRVLLAGKHQMMCIQRRHLAVKVQAQMCVLVAGRRVWCGLHRVHVVNPTFPLDKPHKWAPAPALIPNTNLSLPNNVSEPKILPC